jgi:hypothetical protein
VANKTLLVLTINYSCGYVRHRYSPPLPQLAHITISRNGHHAVLRLHLQESQVPHMEKPGELLERITNSNGNLRYQLTDRQYNKGRNVGKSIQQNCYICRKYLMPNGNIKYNQTLFWCVACKMPLCKKDRSDSSTGRLTSCLAEHQESNCKAIGCFTTDRSYTTFPRALQVNLLRRGAPRHDNSSTGRWNLVRDSINHDDDEDEDDEDAWTGLAGGMSSSSSSSLLLCSRSLILSSNSREIAIMYSFIFPNNNSLSI